MSGLMPRMRHGRWSGEDVFGGGIEGRYFAFTWFGLTVEISLGR
jgi:hypothetical protein